MGGPSPTAITPELQALADNLDHDPVKIFDYVHNKIEFQPYYGSHKGAHLTYLDGAGNDIDQASLLIALLNAAGYTATSYVHGTITMPDQSADGQSLCNWLGVNPGLVLTVLSTTGLTVSAYNAPFYTFDHTWAQVTIAGTTYPLDPSYKQYQTSNFIDVAAASGYSRNQFLTDAGGTLTADYVVNVNRTAIEARLGQCATTLRNYIQANYPNNGADQVLGVRNILERSIATLANGAAPFATRPDDSGGVFATLPPTYQATLEIQIGNIDATFNADSLQGNRLSLVFVSNNAQLWLGDTKVAQETGGSGTIVTLTQTPTHPHGSANGNLPISATYSRTGTYDLVYSFYGNPKSNGRITTCEHRLQNYLAGGLANSSREVSTETLHSLGLQWIRRVDRVTDAVMKFDQGFGEVKHILGRAAQESGYFVDMPGLFLTVLNGGDNSQDFNTITFVASGMEHGAIEQTGGSTALSTVKCLALANDAGKKIFKATAANYTSNVRPFLTDYPTGSSDPFLGDINAGATFLLHENGQLTVKNWKGYGFAEFTGTKLGMGINGGYYGGYNSTTGPISSTITLLYGDVRVDPIVYPPVDIYHPFSVEPVDLVSGSYTMERTDLVLGQADTPRGLNFTRYYDSGRHFQTTTLGNGWRHSCEGKVDLTSDVNMAFGVTQPIDAAQTIVGILAARDFALTSGTPKELLIGALAANWTVNRILNNAANIQLGNKQSSFCSQPDGSWDPPPGGTTTLTGASGTFTLTPRFGGSVVFDAQNRVSQWKDVDNNTETYAYETTTGKLKTVTDKYGRTLTFNYHSSGVGNGLLQNVTDSTGRSVQFSYLAGTYSGANLNVITDPANFTTTLTYDSRNRLTDWKDYNLASVSHNDYDSQDRVYQQLSQNLATHKWLFRYSPGMTLEIDPAGDETAHLFDTKGREVGLIDALGHASSTNFDGQDHVAQTVDATGRTTTFYYDGNQNLFKSTDNNGKDTHRDYDANLRLWKVTDPTGRYLEYGYDSKNHLTDAYDAGRRHTQYFYRPDGLLDHVTDPAANTTSFTSYDAFGNPTGITRADGTTTSATFNARGDMQSYTDGNLKTTFFTQDNRRLPKTRKDARSKTTTWTYDGNANLSTTQDRNLHTTATNYDNLGHLQSVAAPNTGTVTDAYDTRDWLVSIEDGLNHATTYDYYANHQPKSTTNALLIQTAKSEYDDAGRLATQYDGLLHTTQFFYDAVGRLDYTLDALSRKTQHGYDDAGRVMSLENRRDKTFSFGYGAVDGLPTTFSYPSGRQSQIVDRDAHGLPQTVQAPSLRQTILTYDAMKRLQTRTDDAGAVIWTYDNEGNLSDLDEAPSTGGPLNIHREFDEINRVKTCKDALGYTVGYGYDDEGNLTTITYPGNETVTYTYDGSNRLKTVTDWAGRLTTYNYDTAGRLYSVVRPNSTQQVITLDEANRLQQTEEDKLSGTTVVGTFWLAGYGFDNANRLTTFTPTPMVRNYAPPAASMGYDGDNQLISYNGQDVAHDPDGNLSQAPVNGTLLGALNWDARNRLTGAGGVTYTYDAENRRMTSTIGGQSTQYIWSRGGSLDRLLARVNPDGSITRYIYGIGLLYEETTTAGGTAQSPIYYHFDWRGDTVSLSDATGNVTARLSYSPYGEMTVESGTVNTPFCFNGQWGVMTEPNGLLAMQARYYSPIFRRFLNEDPSGFSGGGNLYAFAGGDPVNLLDPFGLGPQGFWNGFANGFANAFQPENLITTAAITVATIVAPEITEPLLFAGAGFAAVSAVDQAAQNGLSFNSNTAGNIAGNLVGSTLVAGVTSAAAGAASSIYDSLASPSGQCFLPGTPIQEANHTQRPIESVHLGDRVLTNDPAHQDSTTEVDPQSWRVVKLRAPNPDGSKDELEMSFLRSPDWLKAEQTEIGHRIWLELPDIGFAGSALVEAIEPCPAIRPGSGRVVTGTITHLNGFVLRLHFEGTNETLCPTETHRLFSETRHSWIPSGELKPGESLKAETGTLQLASLERLSGIHRVYNLEVQGDHRYYAGNVAVLSHNACPVVEQYALKATEDGFYPVMQRGFPDPQGGVFLRAGDVWKYGTTKNPSTRYPQTFLDDWGLVYEKETSGTSSEALSAEKSKILQYLQQNGSLPPGNKIIR